MRTYLYKALVGISMMMMSATTFASSEYPVRNVGGKSFYEYKVEKSEGFYAISKKFGVTQQEIQDANPQTKDGLKVGESLLIPKKANVSKVHRVSQGETLFSLKQKYGLTYDELYEANPQLKTKGLIQGTDINIPAKKGEVVARRNKAEKDTDILDQRASKPVVQAATNTSSPAEAAKEASKTGFTAHEVKKGETLFSVSRAYNITAEEIVKLNPDAKDGIKAGQILIIPPTRKNTTSSATGSTQKSELKTHIVKKGETVYSISKAYGVSQESLISRNPGIDVELAEGKMLIIPPVFESNAFKEQLSEIEAPTFKVHIVSKQETIFGISRMYGISQSDLAGMNPEISGGLKEGMVLRIPLNVSESAADSISNEIGQMFSAEPKKDINVALCLPWNLAKVTESSPIDATTSKFIEYYEGLLLAIDTLKKEGLNVNLHVYDCGKTDAEIKAMLQYGELKTMDFIIGPVHQAQIKAMSDFALTYNIKLVIPFSSKAEEVKENSNIFQINSPQAISAEAVSRQVVKMFKDRKIIIIKFSDPKYNDRQVWADTLKYALDAAGIENDCIVFNSYSELKKYVSKKKTNLIFPATTNQVALNQVLPVINMMKSKEYEIEVFGFSEWQNYQSISKELFKLNTYFTSPFYIEFNHPDVKNFIHKFRKYYNAEPKNTQPMYALLGYDMMIYFGEAMRLYGHDFEWAIERMVPSSLQSQYKFERITPTGGFVNRRHYIIENNEEVGCQKLQE